MEIQRTIRIRLRPEPATATVLDQTIAAYTWSFNAVASHGWQAGIVNGVELHKATYYAHRAQTGLPAQLTCAARVKATEALKSAKALATKGKTVRCPRSKACPVRYDARSYSICFERHEVSLLTLQGRIRLPFGVPAYYGAYTAWDTASADLLKDRKGRWWLHVVMTTTVDPAAADGEVVGVDLGIAHPAADSRGHFFGSDHWQVVENRIFELRRSLQAKGTKSAKRHLKRLSGRQRRFRKDCDHVLSKRLVQSVEPGAVLAFEDLTGIRGRVRAKRAQRRHLHGWSFHQLQMFVEYKAAAHGVAVGYVDPRYTSRKCSTCGHIARSNRPGQAAFKCRSCGHTAHADTNAAVNIRANYLGKGPPVNRPIVSGHRSSGASGTSSAHTR